MKTITIRGVDELMSKTLRERAGAESMSLNQYVLKLLRESLGLTKEKNHTRRYTDLDKLTGLWSEADLAEFEKSQEPFSIIDEELWK